MEDVTDWHPFCSEVCSDFFDGDVDDCWDDDYEPGDEEDYDPLEEERDFGWDDTDEDDDEE